MNDNPADFMGCVPLPPPAVIWAFVVQMAFFALVIWASIGAWDVPEDIAEG